MSELSIFIDESGDFGEYDPRSPYYIIGMVFHDQGKSIDSAVTKLEYDLTNLGFQHHCVHTGPIIRGENEYRIVELAVRRNIIRKMFLFMGRINIGIKTFYIEKKHVTDNVATAGRLAKLISQYIKDNYDYFLSFDIVKIYYDNGQIEVVKILTSVFNSLLDNVEFRKVKPSDYRLFQIADLICTMKLEELKFETNTLTPSDMVFFRTKRTLVKNFLKPLTKLKEKWLYSNSVK